jgi:multidrug efflux pump subunit AcrA (membrane-fusion protein)
VFAIDDGGQARLQPVSPGAVQNDRVEILAGLSEGTLVVATPPASLRDGAPTSGHP